MLFDYCLHNPRRSGRQDASTSIDWAGLFAVMARACCIRTVFCTVSCTYTLYFYIFFALLGPAHTFRKDRNDLCRVAVY